MISNIVVEDINSAYTRVLSLIAHNGRPANSRNGRVLVLPTPLCVTYANPKSRILFNRTRDANPFFHLFESIWMLAGRNDAKFLADIVPNMAQYAEEDGMFHGAYGYRWRNHFGHDQLVRIIDLLKKDPETRRAVLAMHDAAVDQDNSVRDQPCNTHIYFGIRDGRLNMMVCNRSNDLIWGLLGANAVHMSFLQEFIASAVGVPMGEYMQMTFNAHVYIDNPKYETWMSDTSVQGPIWEPADICDEPEHFLTDCELFCAGEFALIQNQWFRRVAIPMWAAYHEWKVEGKYSDRLPVLINNVQDMGWASAAQIWISNRSK